MVRHVRCSFSKIIIGVIVFTSAVIFVKFILKSKGSVPDNILEKILPANERKLKSALPKNDVNLMIQNNLADIKDKLAKEASKDDAEFIDILRVKPKVSFSMSSTLDKLLEDERKIHNKNIKSLTQDQVQLNWPNANAGSTNVGGGELVPNGPSNLSSLKASLKDPSFVQKIRQLEDRRQDLYLSILKKRGQLITHDDGSQTIVSYPQVPLKFPNNLKRDLNDWSKREKVWLNISHFPWPLDETCRKYSVTFAKPKSIPIIGLASYPSSGNTWLRYLIEGITGHYTGSMYNDISLRKKGLYGEGVPSNSGVVVTIKTHGHTTEKGAHIPRPNQIDYNHHAEVNHSAILLIRNPFNAIIGHRNLDQGGHTGLAKEDQFVGPGWQEFVEIKAQAWLNFYSDWLENNPTENILVLHYENIKQSLKFSLRKIAGFLSFEEHQGRIDCTIQFQTGQFKRKHKEDIRDNPYTDEQKEIIASSIRKLNKILKRYQKESLPLQKYEHYKFTSEE
eukprot:GFUD01000984.1.p1 GENE.GFUD01000984.1~~GFUD01000984.1.p1  ORF type:complete len:506 (-),score=105.02 GFUD01000984.1:121-1638(-)